jgi:hypothetical protein
LKCPLLVQFDCPLTVGVFTNIVMYKLDADFATVFAGALDTMPIVLQCYRGIPKEFVKKTEALDLVSKRNTGKLWRIDRYLLLGAFDGVLVAERDPPGGNVA